MEAGLSMPRSSVRAPLPALGRWAAASLGAIALLVAYLQFFIMGEGAPPVFLILGIPALLFAALVVANRWRWAPLLSVVYFVVFMALNAQYLIPGLQHPEFASSFALDVSMLAVAALGTAAGLVAGIQNYRTAPDERPRAPGWFAVGVATLAGLTLGALLVVAIPRADASAGVSAEVLASLPKFAVAGNAFQQSELRVKAGETVALTLVNEDPSGHSFDIDEFDVHAPMLPGQPGLALFKADRAGSYSFYCGLPGHREAGMVGTLIVEP
jgi:uncharacterized cupredoxin-like copper-binding protein